MILVSHPTGNTFVRALLDRLSNVQKLNSFHTAVAVQTSDWYLNLLPVSVKRELLRRSFEVLDAKLYTYPARELVRLAAAKLGVNFFTQHEIGWASVDAVYQELDRRVSNYLETRSTKHLSGVYCYEDAALYTFQVAKEQGLVCFYDLPIAYWETSQQLLQEEAERLPEWEPTLLGTRNSQAKLDRKSRELELADVVICPSQFVYDSLPKATHQAKKCVIAEFGSPAMQALKQHVKKAEDAPLRVLFAGSMSQRKGLADLFAAMKILKRSDVELVIMGSLLMPLEFYRSQFPNFTYEPTRPHEAVLELMQSCDVLVLPSIVEGRALVQQEAMICGLPLIITPNTGGEDLIDEGETGFLIPMRSPEAIAEKINWFAEHRQELEQMRELTQQKAKEKTWQRYTQVILEAIKSVEDD